MSWLDSVFSGLEGLTGAAANYNASEAEKRDAKTRAEQIELQQMLYAPDDGVIEREKQLVSGFSNGQLVFLGASLLALGTAVTLSLRG